MNACSYMIALVKLLDKETMNQYPVTQEYIRMLAAVYTDSKIFDVCSCRIRRFVEEVAMLNESCVKSEHKVSDEVLDGILSTVTGREYY